MSTVTLELHPLQHQHNYNYLQLHEHDPQYQSLLPHTPSDVLVHQTFKYLADTDAFQCMRTCKRIYYNSLPKYHLHRSINIRKLFDQPNFQLDSTRPIPVINRVYWENIGDLDKLTGLRVNKSQIKSLHDVVVTIDFNFSKLPHWLTNLTICNVRSKLIPKCLPLQLKRLGIFNISRNQSFNEPGIFPETLETLKIGHLVLTNTRDEYVMDEPLQPSILPPNLKYLETNCLFEKHGIGKDVLPSTLETLRFCLSTELEKVRQSFGDTSLYNHPLLPGTLPRSLKDLDLGGRFNQPIVKGALPQSLAKLRFGDSFDQPIEPNVLPHSITDLDLGSKFNQLIEPNVLPPSLTQLHFGRDGGKFNQSIAVDVFPQSLKKLSLSDNFNHPIAKNVLPCSLESLSFGYGSVFNYPLLPGVLPHSLKELQFGDKFNHLIEEGVLPQSLQILGFGKFFNQPINSGVLPSSLKSLSFGIGCNFNHPLLPGVLPSELETLEFHSGSKFNQPLVPGVLPQSLNELYFRGKFDQPINKDVLPQSLKSFSSEYGVFNQPIGKGVLPESLRVLKFSSAFRQFLGDDALPTFLVEYWKSGSRTIRC